MSYIRESSLGDPALLAPNLRQADIEEIDAVTHLSPYEVLLAGYHISDPCRTLVGDSGNIVAMFGVSPIPSEDNKKLGVIWCLTSPEMFKIKKYFVRAAYEEIPLMSKGYDKVLNFVYEKNTTHIRWLKAMGFDMSPTPQPFGRLKKPFYYFEKVITNV